jgi:hypothetical protein
VAVHRDVQITVSLSQALLRLGWLAERLLEADGEAGGWRVAWGGWKVCSFMV